MFAATMRRQCRQSVSKPSVVSGLSRTGAVLKPLAVISAPAVSSSERGSRIAVTFVRIAITPCPGAAVPEVRCHGSRTDVDLLFELEVDVGAPVRPGGVSDHLRAVQLAGGVSSDDAQLTSDPRRIVEPNRGFGVAMQILRTWLQPRVRIRLLQR